MDILKDLEFNEGPIWPKDMHDNIVMLEYIYIGDMFARVITKKRDQFLQWAKRFHLFQVWVDGKVKIMLHPTQ
jgi:hypothetical protein